MCLKMQNVIVKKPHTVLLWNYVSISFHTSYDIAFKRSRQQEIYTACHILLVVYWRIKWLIDSVERVSAQCCCIPYAVIKIFDCNCNDLELSQLKDIQGQRSLSKSKVCWLFPIWPHSVRRRISHRIRDIWCQNPVTLNYGGSRSFKVKDHGANR